MLVLTLIGLVSTMRMDAYVTPTIDTDCSCHIYSLRTYLTNRMGFISHHITPLVINSLGGGHIHTRILSRTEAILRNQACASRRPVRAWFKNNCLLKFFVVEGSTLKGCRRTEIPPIQLKLDAKIVHNIRVLVM